MTLVPLQISDEFYDEIARRVASLLEQPPGAEWMTIDQAARHLQLRPIRSGR
jgi:hypothetical protein